MPSKSEGRAIDHTEHLNPSPQVGKDTDMLSQPELREDGFTVARRRHRNAVSGNPKCSDCGRTVATPVTSFVRNGYDFMESGELLHEKCAFKRYEAVLQYLLKLSNTE